MKPVRTIAGAVGLLLAVDLQAHADSQPISLFTQLKKAISRVWQGKNILEASVEIYSGGVPYVTTMVSPNRNEKQVKDGAAGGMTMVAGTAHLAGAIASPAGITASMVAKVLGDGKEVVPAGVSSNSKISRIILLLDGGDGATLDQEDLERIQNYQQAGERFKSTLTYQITKPRDFNYPREFKGIEDHEKEIPKIINKIIYKRPELNNNSNNNIIKPVDIDSSKKITDGEKALPPPSEDEQARDTLPACGSEDAFNNSIKNDCPPPEEEKEVEEEEEVLPYHWKTISAFGRDPNGPLPPKVLSLDTQLNKCVPIQAKDSYEYIAMMRETANNGACSEAKFIESSKDRLTYTFTCSDGAVPTTILMAIKANNEKTITTYMRQAIEGSGFMEKTTVESYCG